VLISAIRGKYFLCLSGFAGEAFILRHIFWLKNIFHFYPTIFLPKAVYITKGKYSPCNQHLGNTASHNGTGLQKAGNAGAAATV
jgi:hypothetical protein